MFNRKKRKNYINENFERLNTEIERLNNKIDMMDRVARFSKQGKITYVNELEFVKVNGGCKVPNEFVYIYKDKEEYKIDALHLVEPKFELITDDFLKIISNERSTLCLSMENTYYVDLENCKIVKEVR